MSERQCAGGRRRLQRVGHYDLGKTIGRGNFAQVRLGRHDLAKAKVAVKVVDKTAVDADNLAKIHREIRILKSLSHPHIIRLYQVMENETSLYMVTEYASGGELFEMLVDRGRLAETDARRLFRQIVAATAYCHSSGVVHRDLKAENLLLDRYGNIKLIDFGFSNFYMDGQLLSTWCGSPPYAAPELFLGHDYDGTKADVWSLGVVLYILVSGGFPFPGNSIERLKRSVLSGQVKIPYFVSVECSDLIRKMLVVNAARRFTISQVVQHRWFSLAADWTPALDALFKLSFGHVDAPPTVADGPLNQTVLMYIQQKAGWPAERVAEAVVEKRFDSPFAAYALLCDKLQRLGNEASLNTINVDQQARRGSRGSITTGVANVELTEETPVISASDFAKLNLALSPEQDSADSLSDSDAPADPSMAPHESPRRHTLCMPAVQQSLLSAALFMPPFATNAAGPPPASVPFPLQAAVVGGELLRLPVGNPAVYGAALPSSGAVPLFARLDPALLDSGWARRSSDGEAAYAMNTPRLQHARKSLTNSAMPVCAPRAAGGATVPSADEVAAKYNRRHRRTVDCGASFPLGRNSSSAAAGSTLAARRSKGHIRRSSCELPLGINYQQMNNLERLYNQSLATGGSPAGSANLVQQLQQEFQQLRASTELKQLASAVSGTAVGTASSSRGSPPPANCLDMIAELDPESGAGSPAPKICLSDQLDATPLHSDVVVQFERQIVHGRPAVTCDEATHSLSQYYYSSAPAAHGDELGGGGGGDKDGAPSMSAVVGSAAAHIFEQLKAAMQRSRLRFTEDGLALAVEDGDGSRVLIRAFPLGNACRLDFTCVRGERARCALFCERLLKSASVT